MTVLRRSPIEMMVDRACGFDPNKVKPRPMVTLRCPDCKRQKRVPKESTDPKRTAYVEALCDKCDHGGGKPETMYFDALNRQINPRTGRPFRRADGESDKR